MVNCLKNESRFILIYSSIPLLHCNSKWSRREEADFYRVVSSFGVERVMAAAGAGLGSPSESKSPRKTSRKKVFVGYNWQNFKLLANLVKKSDQAVTDYYNAFFTMCHRVCREAPPEGRSP